MPPVSELVEPPSLRKAMWGAAVCWLACAVGVVLALYRGDWLTVIYAMVASAIAASWLLAIRQWVAWRAVAVRALGELPWVVVDEDEPS